MTHKSKTTLFKSWLVSLFLVLIFWHLPVFSWNLSSENLQRNVMETPDWMLEGIQRDFSAFQKGFSRDDISQCIEKLKQLQGIEAAGLVRFDVSNRKLSYEPLFELSTEQKQWCKGFLSALRQLDQISPLPTIQFLITFNRTFERPLLLKETFVPIFAVSKEKHNRKVVLIPRLWDINREMRFDVFSNWNQKIEKAFWRGVTTDGPYGFYDWDTTPRTHMVMLSRHYPDLLDASFIPSSILSTYMTNWIKGLNFYSDPVPPNEMAFYKYLLSLDGKSSTSSLEWQLFSGSVILKTPSNKVEWFYHALSPGKHYITINPNGYDVIEKIMWLMSHDNEARELAENSHTFALHHLMDEGAFTYLHHVLNFYASLYRQ